MLSDIMEFKCFGGSEILQRWDDGTRLHKLFSASRTFKIPLPNVRLLSKKVEMLRLTPDNRKEDITQINFSKLALILSFTLRYLN